jgi:hypothetical protein
MRTCTWLRAAAQHGTTDLQGEHRRGVCRSYDCSLLRKEVGQSESLTINRVVLRLSLETAVYLSDIPLSLNVTKVS